MFRDPFQREILEDPGTHTHTTQRTIEYRVQRLEKMDHGMGTIVLALVLLLNLWLIYSEIGKLTHELCRVESMANIKPASPFTCPTPEK